MKTKIVTILGARPQFIKAAAVSRELEKSPYLNEVIIHTGQHFDKNMSDIFFEELELPKPTYMLNINSSSHAQMTGMMLQEIERVLTIERPEYVMVYGDTNSTLAGALAAKKIHVKVIHVESGLRSFNMKMPEEINRTLTDRISDILFCPTDKAIENLAKEGYKNFDCRIVKSGDVMQDAALYYSTRSIEGSKIIQKLSLGSFILCTIHRAENTNDPATLKSIINALNEISAKLPVVLPIHPRTRKIIEKENILVNCTVIDPVGYLDMIELLKKCQLVMTDSGGLQKEAFFFGKNCITLRNETEWTELVDNGFNILSGTSTKRIMASFNEIVRRKNTFSINLYGNGEASKIIREVLEESHQ